jgi:5-(carboxyamino)imidazole ribonucleotide synthase
MTIGVLGGGQLGRMLALAGYPLGLRFCFLDPSPQAPAAPLADLIAANFDDVPALERFAAEVVIIAEFKCAGSFGALVVQSGCVYPPRSAR